MKTYSDKTAWMALTAGCAMLIGGIAAAQQIDKGDLGTYERHGRFVHRVADGGGSSSGATMTASKNEQAGVVYDKGEVGTWIRDGKYVRKARPASSATPSKSIAVARDTGTVLDHKTHVHNLP